MAPDLLSPVLTLVATGGPVMGVIFATSALMWALILERYWYLLVVHPRSVRTVVERWTAREDHDSWHARRIREGLVSETSMAVGRFLMPIGTLTALLPMLGLLGTVAGMIETFEAISAFGATNAKGLAGGISKALLTTMAGLVTSLSGLYFSVDLGARARREVRRVADLLVQH